MFKAPQGIITHLTVKQKAPLVTSLLEMRGKGLKQPSGKLLWNKKLTLRELNFRVNDSPWLCAQAVCFSHEISNFPCYWFRTREWIRLLMSKNHQDATSSLCLSDSLLRHMLLAGEFNSTYPCTCLEECQVFIIHYIWKQSIQRLISMANPRILWSLLVFKSILYIYFYIYI